MYREELLNLNYRRSEYLTLSVVINEYLVQDMSYVSGEIPIDFMEQIRFHLC
jgi:hypothetical protein